MGKLRVNCFAISIDGYGAGTDQSIDHPLGVGGTNLHQWFYPTKTFKSMFGEGEGSAGIDDDFAQKGTENIGAWILGRNMFGPIRGAWTDNTWKGWWGDNPPYHVPVFVLTHHPRKFFEMEGGTTFHFITEGIEKALKEAQKAAGSKDIRLGGGVDTIQQYLNAQLVDEMHLVVAPTFLGAGESFFGKVNLPKLGYSITDQRKSEATTHLVIKRHTL